MRNYYYSVVHLIYRYRTDACWIISTTTAITSKSMHKVCLKYCLWIYVCVIPQTAYICVFTVWAIIAPWWWASCGGRRRSYICLHNMLHITNKCVPEALHIHSSEPEVNRNNIYLSARTHRFIPASGPACNLSGTNIMQYDWIRSRVVVCVL